MTRTLFTIFRRDLALLLMGAPGRGGALLPLLFFLAVAMLYPFAVGPDARLLARTGAGLRFRRENARSALTSPLGSEGPCGRVQRADAAA